MGPLLAGLAAAIGGMLVAAQGPIYARLAAGLSRDSLAAVFVAFLTATAFTGIAMAVLGNWRSLSFSGLAALPTWVWLGGLLGACHVVISMQAIPLIGATGFLVLVVAGNLVGATTYDHFGLFELTQRPFTSARFFGLMFVLVGVFITVRA